MSSLMITFRARAQRGRSAYYRQTKCLLLPSYLCTYYRQSKTYFFPDNISLS